MAVFKCSKLHRDFSAWNILYDPQSERGILTDWDLCAPMPSLKACEEDPTINPLAQIPNSSGRSYRTGTWMFMSVSVQGEKPHLHCVQDDLEALFWVGVYMITLYMPVPTKDALAIVDEFLLHYTLRDGVPVGGAAKRAYLTGTGNIDLSLPPIVFPALTSWLTDYGEMLDNWYRHLYQLDKHQNRANAKQPTAPALRDYNELDKLWKEILENGEFVNNDRLNDKDYMRDPFHVTAVYRKSLAKDANKRMELEASARFDQAESQRAEAEARRAESQRADLKASIELGLGQNSGAGTSHSNTLFELSAAVKEDKEDKETEETEDEEDEDMDDEEDKGVFGPRFPSPLISAFAGDDGSMGSWDETDAADETIEEEAGRAAKRRRSTSAGAFFLAQPGWLWDDVAVYARS